MAVLVEDTEAGVTTRSFYSLNETHIDTRKHKYTCTIATSKMRAAHMRMAKETSVEREHSAETAHIVKNFFKRLFGKCVTAFCSCSVCVSPVAMPL